MMSTANGMNGGLADPAAAGGAPDWAGNDAFASGFDNNKSPVSRVGQFFKSMLHYVASARTSGFVLFSLSG